MVSLYKRILVINLMHIGDLLLVTPVLRTLRTNFSEAHLALLADAKLADLVKYNANINELIAIDKKGYHNKLWNYSKLIGEIRRKKFDLVINLHRNERASFLAGFSGAGKIVGYSTLGPHLFFDKVIENRKETKHQVEAHFDVLRETLGITNIDDRGLEMWLDEAAKATADRMWKEAFPGDPGPVIGLNIGASWPTKKWPKEYYAELADRLLDKGYGVAFFGGPMDVETVEQAIAHMKNGNHPNVAVFTGRVSLLELAALLKKCRVLATNDSGPMHVSVAVGTPAVAVFGASPVTGFAPYDKRSIAIKSPVNCHPCGEHECDHLSCMWAVKPDEFLQKIEIVLDKSKTSSV